MHAHALNWGLLHSRRDPMREGASEYLQSQLAVLAEGSQGGPWRRKPAPRKHTGRSRPAPGPLVCSDAHLTAARVPYGQVPSELTWERPSSPRLSPRVGGVPMWRDLPRSHSRQPAGLGSEWSSAGDVWGWNWGVWSRPGVGEARPSRQTSLGLLPAPLLEGWQRGSGSWAAGVPSGLSLGT